MTFESEINSLYKVLTAIALMLGILRCIFIIQKARNDEKPLSSTFDECKKIVTVIILICSMDDLVMILSNIVGIINNTADLKENINTLVTYVTNIAISINLPVTVFCVIKELLLGIQNLEEKDIYLKKARRNLIIGISILTISAVLKIIAYNYFNING